MVKVDCATNCLSAYLRTSRRKAGSYKSVAISTVRWLLRPAGGRILPILLSAVRRYIEQTVGVRQTLHPARVRRVGVENVVIDSEEDAEPMRFTFDLTGTFVGEQFRFRAVVVFNRRDLLVQSHVKVIVEIAAEG